MTMIGSMDCRPAPIGASRNDKGESVPLNVRQEIVSHPNDPTLRSYIDVDATSDFPIQNLPYGVILTSALPTPRVGVGIGDCVRGLSGSESERLIGLPPTRGP